ncbi:hypothetical protein PUN28_007232 [Cardiocondyla obscurior]|uniref:DNA repair protein RAD52-like protein n=1 Tax=Cardiocondyla obscurior TaxID=286306 RepID=A0AAW2G767_9HYME
MYNRHEYLSCIKIPAAKQSANNDTRVLEKANTMDLVEDRRKLISAANKVFGEGKWNHTVVNQTLDFVEAIGAKCCVGCVSYVRVQLENGNYHEDIGYYTTEESTKGSSIHNARIGSVVNALKTVLLSFGGEIETEIQEESKISSKQVNNVQKDVTESDNRHVVEKEKAKPSPKKISMNEQNSKPDSVVSTVNIAPAETKLSVKDKSPIHKIIEYNLINADAIDKDPPVMSEIEKQRLERKRRQQQKQMEFKRRMMESNGLIDTNDNKPNPRY